MIQKIAIPTSNGTLCPHFGHCEAFAIFHVEDGKIIREETLDPPTHEPGSHPRFLKEQGCSVIIAGGMGIKAQEIFAANAIQVIVGVENKSLNQLVELYLQDNLFAGSNLCDH